MYPYDIISGECNCGTICRCKQFWEGNDPSFPEPTLDSRLSMDLTGTSVTIDDKQYTLLSNRDILLQCNYAGRIIGHCEPYTLIRWNGHTRHEAHIVKSSI